MKLYTEEQVKESLMKHQDSSMFLSVDQIDYLISEITPIELPSDEEMGVIALNIASTLEDKLDSRQEAFYLGGFLTCNQWLKEQILKQNL